MFEDDKADEDVSAFRTPVDKSSFCYQRAAQTVKKLPVGNKVLAILEENLQNYPTVKWQYFGTKSGLHVTYPKSLRRNPNNCYGYDSRSRPW